MFYSVLFSFLPEPSKVVFLSKNFLTTYASFYLSIKERALTYHKRKLCGLDPDFKLSEVNKKLVRSRRAALEQNIDPLSSKYPDISYVLVETILNLVRVTKEKPQAYSLWFLHT